MLKQESLLRVAVEGFLCICKSRVSLFQKDRKNRQQLVGDFALQNCPQLATNTTILGSFLMTILCPYVMLKTLTLNSLEMSGKVCKFAQIIQD